MPFNEGWQALIPRGCSESLNRPAGTIGRVPQAVPHTLKAGPFWQRERDSLPRESLSLLPRIQKKSIEQTLLLILIEIQMVEVVEVDVIEVDV